MRNTQHLFIAVALLFASACSSKSPPPKTPEQLKAEAGDPNAEPAIAALPAMLRTPADLDDRMHPVFAAAGEIFGRKLPEPPADRSYASLSDWVEDTIAPWIEARRDAIDDVRFQVHGQSPKAPELVVAGALVGLLEEDTALELERIPAPSELDKEPQVAAMFHDVIRVQAKPFIGSALRDFRDCANTGYREAGDLERWARFCHARFDRLHASYGDKSMAPPQK